ncbi:cation diffusion facilitator family transporter [Cereibacter sphaeroides]|uniref:cation diffusion facilitator family transporter n=1 Tax=Cereibacter sphaeroides TaxID=1063 RepID=UPI000F5363B7|nr:cation diffusion facilitator family transporter [Cereibacter sphaeroides]AZB54781.1 cation transporter [Cereibacter sphaeroides]AZB59037.1 cation transporter [Cereibacter sphaeroides]AZB63115.1 cation transporter [Cereibacter sphaeroides]AZB68917.1 cation transporter [Cereibacter sphaeroides]MWP38940.1 cation diffusion facilitator family transporter [Cereibacter sphaeroides]
MSQTLKLAVGSLIVGVVVLGLKALAWWMTGSIALLSDAMESIVNVAAAGVALVAIRVAAIPADANHPYGHHKAEFLSAVLEGAMIIVAALLILREATLGFLDPKPLVAPVEGLLVNGSATLLNALWSWVLISRGRRLRSPALIADGRHLLADVVSSVGVTVGVLAAIFTGWSWLDPALAALVAVNVLWSGWVVVSSSVSGLMDESVSDEVLVRVREVISQEAVGAVEAHDLRTRHAGQATFIDFHLVVTGETTVAAAHDICDRIESALHRLIPHSRVSIHVEPEHKAKHNGIVVL